MILGFGVEGFLSFKEKQYIYFIPPKGARIKNTKYFNNFHLDFFERPMKSAIIFGNNASGKTNWFYALKELQSILKQGLSTENLTKRFNKQSEAISFEISIMNKSSDIYDYELSFDKSGQVLKERLDKNNANIFNFKENSLSLSSGIDLEDEEQKGITELVERLFSTLSTDTFLRKINDIVYSKTINEFKSLVLELEVEIEDVLNKEVKYFPVALVSEDEKEQFISSKDNVISILKALDKSITEIQFKERVIEDGLYYELFLVRGEGRTFDVAFESQGIRKVINLLPSFLSLEKGKTVFIDELDSSIGSRALIEIFNKFVNSSVNTKGQLIISTHNLTLLNLDMFHASQLYVVKKTENLTTEIDSIDDYDFRASKKGISELYLKGLFDAQ